MIQTTKKIIISGQYQNRIGMYKPATYCFFDRKIIGANCTDLANVKFRQAVDRTKDVCPAIIQKQSLPYRIPDAKHILSVHKNPTLCIDKQDVIYSRLKV